MSLISDLISVQLPLQTQATRFPEKVYTHLLDLIGKPIDNPLVQLYQRRFPYHNITADPETSGLLLHHPDGLTFTPEELLAMILEKVRLYAELYVGQSARISDCTIIVPSYFTQNERKAVLKAAKLAGLNVLQLMNGNTAVALNYGLFRTADFVENKPKNYIFYDMGSSSTEATVVSYQIKRIKESAYPTKTPELSVLGIGYDRTLGGFEMQLRLRDHLAKLFEEQSKGKQDVFNNKRAMSKLLKEAGKVKNMLSANNEISVRVENVMNDIDLKTSVKRSELEEICADLLNERIRKPVEDALLSSGLTIAEIEQIILFGGNTRTPKIQQSLAELVDKELGKNVNSDEAASLGAAYLAGKLSKGFRAKDFIINEHNLFPITVDFLKNVSHDPNSDTRLVQRVLYTRGNAYPMKKVFTFNKKNSDFEFAVNYGDLSFLSKAEQSYIGSKNLFKVSLSNFDRFINNYADADKYEPKGVKTHFVLNENGIVGLTTTEYVFNEKVEEEVPDLEGSNVVSDAISNLGSKIGSLFTSTAEKDDATVTGENQTASADEKKEAVNATANATAEDGTQVNVTRTKIEIKIKPIKEKIDKQLAFDFDFGGDDVFKKSKDKLLDLKRQETSKLARDSAKNALESFIVESKTRLYDEEYEKASSEEERERLMKILTDASEWLEFESDNAETKAFNEKTKALGSQFEELYKRVEEHRERPTMVKTLEETIEHGNTFLVGARNLSKELEIFTEAQLVQLETVLVNVNSWKEEKQIEQAKTPLYETPKLTIAELLDKINVLRGQINNLVNIAKTAKRPPPPPKKPATKEENKTSEQAEKSEEAKPDAQADGQKVNPEEENRASAEETLEKLNQSEATIDPTKSGKVDSSSSHTEL